MPFRFKIKRAAAAILWIGGGMLAASLPAQGGALEKQISFNQDIRPILSENCFLCHGPDESNRKGKLRLDLRDEALKPASSGGRAIVPGKPGESALLARVNHSDPDELMPPVKTGKRLSQEQIDTLRRWIEQGAPYAVHWAYATPQRPDFPKVRDGAWPRQGLDYFVLERLDREQLAPMPEADRLTLARRAALDLTGLPPTLEEVDAFVADPADDAYGRYVDRLLAKESFGEHWARLWLDLARYADSAGYADDPLRTIWGYRDYVIRAFNENKPFDQFTIEQMAGDLLEAPTEEQLIATAFHRNTMTNNEGGTTDEEFRNAAVVDRVNTTMAVWMGTSMACAQCHTHKYDPISQQEYFQFLAFLDNTEDADRPDESPVLSFFTNSQKARRQGLESTISDLEKILRTPKPEHAAGFAAWQGGFPADTAWQTPKAEKVEARREGGASIGEDGAVRIGAGSSKDVWTVELPLAAGDLTALRIESLPESSATPAAAQSLIVSRIAATLLPPKANSVLARYLRIELPGAEKILSLAEVQIFSGADNIASTGEAAQSSTEFGGKPALAIDGKTNGDFQAGSTTHTRASDSPWWEVDLKQLRTINRIVVWNRTDNNLQSRLKDFRIVALDESRNAVWQQSAKDAPNPQAEFAIDGIRPIRFAGAFVDHSLEGENPAAVLAEKPDARQGWRLVSGEGRARQLHLLTTRNEAVPEGSKLRVTLERQGDLPPSVTVAFKISTTPDARLLPYGTVPSGLLTLLHQRPESRTPETQNRLQEYYLAQLAPELASERTRLAEARQQIEAIKPSTVPILRELAGDKRRKTHLQYRGNYADLGVEVTEAVPAAFQPLPAGAPKNRLTLAKWLIDSANPLTARVIANRFWEQVFGVGLVRTSEEFGSQGEPPSHPELLDWLATELVNQRWDTKRFLKMLVTSAAYRQSSRVTPDLDVRDPENRLLARGPRFRMSAEMVRDQALFIGGLLSSKMYGPSVKPPRPASGLSAAFGSSVDWKTSDGEDRLRRALYTEWRRTSPYPSMSTFDAPNREVCTLRRTRTNTPLQALVTMNDPVYLEASQALGRRMAGHGGPLADKLRYGFRLCLARSPSEAELARLVSLFGETLAEYAKAGPDNAKKMATEPIGALPEGADPVESAAWATVASVLLNLDETLMKR